MGQPPIPRCRGRRLHHFCVNLRTCPGIGQCRRHCKGCKGRTSRGPIKTCELCHSQEQHSAARRRHHLTRTSSSGLQVSYIPDLRVPVVRNADCSRLLLAFAVVPVMLDEINHPVVGNHDNGCCWLKKWSAGMKMQTSHSLRQHGSTFQPCSLLAVVGSTFQPCSLLAVVSNMLFVTVLAMVYLLLDSNQRVYLRRLDSNVLVSVNNILLVTVYWQLEWFTCDCIPISRFTCGEWDISICSYSLACSVSSS